MNLRLALTLFVLAAMVRSVTADYVTWNVVDLKGDPYSKTVVRFTPVRGWFSDGTNTVVDVARSSTPSATGGGRTKVLGGVYKVTADGAPGSTLIAVPGDGGEYTLNQCAQFATNCPPFFFTNFFGRISERVKVSGEGVAIVTNNPGAWNEYISLAVAASSGPTNGVTAATATNIAVSIAADTNTALLAAIYSASNTAYTAASGVASGLDAARRAEISAASNSVFNAAQSALSAVDQALKIRIGIRKFNVMSYGAIPDDGLDDSAAIWEAFQAWTNSSVGGVLYFPAGKYYDTNTYRVDWIPGPASELLESRRWIQGDGSGSTVWESYGTSHDFFSFSGSPIGIQGISVKNMRPDLERRGFVALADTGTQFGIDLTLIQWDTGWDGGGGAFGRMLGVQVYKCGTGLRCSGYTDGWFVIINGRLCYRTALEIGGTNHFADVKRSGGGQYHVTGIGNKYGVVVGASSSAIIHGYMEFSTNCIIAIGHPPEFGYPNENGTIHSVRVSMSGVQGPGYGPGMILYAQASSISVNQWTVSSDQPGIKSTTAFTDQTPIKVENRGVFIELSTGAIESTTAMTWTRNWQELVSGTAWGPFPMMWTDVITTNAVKNVRLASAPWNSNMSQPQAMIYSRVNSATSATLNYGGGTSVGKPYTEHKFWTGDASAIGGGSNVFSIFPSGAYGSGAGLTNIPLTGVSGLSNALYWLTNNTGGGAVSSVNAKTGAVMLSAADVGAQPVLGFAPQYGTANGTNWAQISTNVIEEIRQKIEDTTLDLSAEEIGNVTNWAKVPPADWRESKATKTLVVDAENGNDSTGLRGREDRSFASLGAASVASAPGDVILVRPGSNYVSSSVWLKTNVTVRGFGAASKIYGGAGQTSQAVLAITNSGVTIEDVWVSAAGTAIGYIGGAGNLAYATNVVLRNVHADGGEYGVAWAGDSIGDGNGHGVTLLMESCVVDASTNGIGVRILGHTNGAAVRMVNCNVTGTWDAVILGGCVAVIEGGRYIATEIDGVTTGNYADVTVRNAYVRGGPSANFDLFNDGYPGAVLREDGVDYRTPEVGGDGWDKVTHVSRQGVLAGEVRTGSLVVSNGINATNLTGTIDPARLPVAVTNSIVGGINLSNPAVCAIYMLSITEPTTISAFGNMHASEFRTASLWITNGGGSTYTLTLPAGTSCPDGNPLYVTNGQRRCVSIGGIINFTNAISRALP